MSYDSRPQNMLSKAVDEVCEIHPRLVLMPYEQMKAAALILAGKVIELENNISPLKETVYAHINVNASSYPGEPDFPALCSCGKTFDKCSRLHDDHCK
jgi:hypothetical protein